MFEEIYSLFVLLSPLFMILKIFLIFVLVLIHENLSTIYCFSIRLNYILSRYYIPPRAVDISPRIAVTIFGVSFISVKNIYFYLSVYKLISIVDNRLNKINLIITKACIKLKIKQLSNFTLN